LPRQRKHVSPRHASDRACFDSDQLAFHYELARMPASDLPRAVRSKAGMNLAGMNLDSASYTVE
jgi:hypothetical protein